MNTSFTIHLNTTCTVSIYGLQRLLVHQKYTLHSQRLATFHCGPLGDKAWSILQYIRYRAPYRWLPFLHPMSTLPYLILQHWSFQLGLSPRECTVDTILTLSLVNISYQRETINVILIIMLH